MPEQSTWSVAARNTKLNAVRSEFDNGFLRFYGDDSDRPDSNVAASAANRLLAELRFRSRAFPPAVNGMLVAMDLIPDSDARATGKPRWYRCYKQDGITEIHGGSVGTADSNAILPADMIVQHAIIECPEFVIIEAATVAA